LRTLLTICIWVARSLSMADAALASLDRHRSLVWPKS